MPSLRSFVGYHLPGYADLFAAARADRRRPLSHRGRLLLHHRLLNVQRAILLAPLLALGFPDGGEWADANGTLGLALFAQRFLDQLDREFGLKTFWVLKS